MTHRTLLVATLLLSAVALCACSGNDAPKHAYVPSHGSTPRTSLAADTTDTASRRPMEVHRNIPADPTLEVY